MKKNCEQCDKKIGKQSKILVVLCKAKKVSVCSIKCYNDWEVESIEKSREKNERLN